MRVLRVLTRPNVGGPMRQAVALWHAHRELGVTTVLAVGRCEPGEAGFDLGTLGIPLLEAAAVGREPAGGLVQLESLQRAFAPRRDAAAQRELRQLIAAFAPDVVHTHTSKAGAVGRRAARSERVPVLAHTFHGHVLKDYFTWPFAYALRRLERRLARTTHLLFAVSASCAEELAALGVAPPERFEVTPPAVAVAPFAATTRAAARALLQRDDAQPLVAFAGRLVGVKNPALFVAMLDELPGVEGHVFGDGPLRTALSARATGSRVTGRLVPHGARPDLAAVLAGFDVLVVPSEREGCPLAAIEAFAAGVPVVGFDVPGVRDALGTWGAGVLVPRRAGAPGLATAVRGLLRDPEERARLADRARTGLARFAPAAVAAQLLQGYERALSGGAGGGSTSGPAAGSGRAISE